jgi:ABC transport system ATP-binding/permease protein
VILDDASVSRHHARLTPRGRYWVLEDLDSSHGVFVNGRRVAASLLRPGDQVRIGGVMARLARIDAAKPE